MFTRPRVPAALLLLISGLQAFAQTVSFLPHRDIAASPGPCVVGPGCWVAVSGDFNGDGKTDLVVGDDIGELVLLLGDGAGGFKPGIPILNMGPGALLAADVNGDKRLDLIFSTGSAGQEQTFVMLGKGDGTFEPAQAIAAGVPLFVVDLNGDSKPDLGVWLQSANRPCQGQVLLGNGDGTFQKPLSTCIPAVDSMGDQALIADFNGDGIPDLAWSGARSDGYLDIVYGNGDGTFRVPNPPAFGTGPPPVFECEGARRPLAAGDLDRDGKLDLVAAGSGGCIGIYFGNGNVTILTAFDLVPASGLQSPHSIFVADFNGDGNLDIAYDNVVLLGNGDGTFQPARYFLTASAGATSVAAADLNGDGLPDLVYVDFAGPGSLAVNGLSVLLNGTPGPPSSVIGHSAATGTGPVAPSSMGSIYGKDLARTTAVASAATPPAQLGGISLRVRDQTGTVRYAPLLYVSPTQINFLVPDQTVAGPVVLTVDDGSGSVVETANATVVAQVAPSLFAADGTGHGAAAATAVRILADGTEQPVTVFSCNAQAQCSTVPIDLSGGEAIYLSLYGTGFRGAQPASLTKCQIGGSDATVQFAGAQPTIPGLDQINVLLPTALPSGTTSVRCQFNFYPTLFSGPATTNSVQIEIK